mmetsp:Transcript_21977/g.47312  ORF Transcript_21977/g.47312 Transcript_21977/m.47312 type:complete len:275 (-) Transcript_21977:696-1520(-)
MIPSGLTEPISSMEPLRMPSMSMTEPEYSSGSSTSTSSKGSQRLPSISCSITLGQPIIISKPSRRIDSTSTVRWRSPRPKTCMVSESPVSLTCSATLVSISFSRRSRMLREVSSLPERPAKGDLLTDMAILIVGSSTSMGSRGRGSEGSTSVSPMLKSAMPEKTTISPAEASSTGLRPSASNAKSSETLHALGAFPGPWEMAMAVFFLMVPDLIRPMPSRPMKGSEAMFEICSCSGWLTSHSGLGRSRMQSSSGAMSAPIWSGSGPAIRLMAEE